MVRSTRRQVLSVGGLVGVLGISGCGQRADDSTADTATPVPTRSPTATRSDDGSPPTRSELYVGPDGSDSNPGSKDSPLKRIQTAIDRAKAGDTVQVLPGEYRQGFGSVRAGRAGEPITITGPPDAVLRPPEGDATEGGVSIVHSHVHLTGLTLNGLADPETPDDHRSYSRFLVRVRPPSWKGTYPDYLTDVAVKPHRIGNAQAKLIATIRTNSLEIGEFEVIGPAGVAWTRGPKSGYALGEVVSLGRSANNFGTDAYPWPGPDRSHDVHIHHIANLEGYDHTALVKPHGGMYDVTVEYCTDDGGFGRGDGGGASVAVSSARTTVRWNRFRNGAGSGVSINVLGDPKEDSVHDQFATLPADQYPGRNNAVYRNSFADLAGQAVAIDVPDEGMNGASLQRVLCGNEIEGGSQAGITEPCPDDVPIGDGVGHTGGESPWGN